MFLTRLTYAILDHWRRAILATVTVLMCFSCALAQGQSTTDETRPDPSNPNLLDQFRPDQSNPTDQQSNDDMLRQLQQQPEPQPIRITNTPNRIEEPSPDAARTRTGA